ncbi:hypothetical protein EMIT0194P_100109 [Pseudomonas serbica]
MSVVATDYLGAPATIGKAQLMRLRDASHGETRSLSNGRRSGARWLRLSASADGEP